MEWYNKSADDALREQNTDAARGLAPSGARSRLERFGENVWTQKQNAGVAGIVLAQLSDLPGLLSLVSMVLALATRQYAAAVLFLIAAAARIVPGVLQDLQASRAAELLENITPAAAKVLRDGRAETLPSREIVPGDIVLLEAGDIVPADLRLLEAFSLQIDESVITGSRAAVYKDAGAVLPGPAPVSDRVNMAYAGSAVLYGRGRGVVVATGAKTELGMVACELHTADAAESGGALRGVGQGIGLACVAGWIVLLILGIARREMGDVMRQMTAFASAVLPAGMAVVATLSLMEGTKRLSKRGAQLKRLNAAVMLGAANVICADKTGTLTKNEMTATMLWTGGRLTAVDGEGYAPAGGFYTPGGEKLDPLSRRDLVMSLTAAALCSNAALEETSINTWAAVGNPTEAALVALAAKAGIDKAVLDRTFPRIAEIPFQPERGMMTTIHHGRHFPVAYSKGAPDVILARCTEIDYGGRREPMTPALKQKILSINRVMSEQSLRVLAVAYREFTSAPQADAPEELENRLIFLGLIGMMDPARPDSAEAVARCRRAGIRTIMVTGESRGTAVAVAKSVGILGADGDDAVLTGEEIAEMSDGTMRAMVKNTKVFARVTAEHKQRILDALHRNGDVVAMTGDGVSDVPLLRSADIGIAKGKTGTEIARSAADLVIEDDKFSTIVSAIGEGRVLYENIRRVAKLLLGACTAAAVTGLIAALCGMAVPFPIAAALLCGLILFSLPAAVIGRQSGEKDAMKRPPRTPGCASLNWAALIEIAAQAVIQAGCCIIMLFAASKLCPIGVDTEAYRMTAVFTVFVISTLLCALSARYVRTPMWETGNLGDFLQLVITVVFGILVHVLVVCAPALRNLFGMTELGGTGFLLVFGLSVLALALTEAFKLVLLPAIRAAFPALERGPKALPRAQRARKRPADAEGAVSGSDPTQEDEEIDVAGPVSEEKESGGVKTGEIPEETAAPEIDDVEDVPAPDYGEAVPEETDAPDMPEAGEELQEIRELEPDGEDHKE